MQKIDAFKLFYHNFFILEALHSKEFCFRPFMLTLKAFLLLYLRQSPHLHT